MKLIVVLSLLSYVYKYISCTETCFSFKVSLVLRQFMNTSSVTISRIRMKAHELFMQYGLKSVSMDDIAQAMGMSKKTIYQCYADKENLVAAVVQNIISETEETCNRDILISKNAIHEIFLAMNQMSNLFKTMNPSILFDLQKYYPTAFNIFYKHKNEYIFNKIKENLLRGIHEELYRSEINIEALSRFRVESIILPFNPEFQTATKMNLVDISQELSTHFLFGITTIKGQKQINKYILNPTN